MEIRRATEDDLVLLARLNGSVQALHAAAHPRLFKQAPDERAVRGWFATFLARPEAEVLIGVVANEVVGYAAGYSRPYPDNPFRRPLTIGIVDQLAVEPTARGRGFGGRLLDALLDQFRAAGVDRVELSVWAFNEGARTFYERRGFAVAHQTMALEQ